MSANATRNGVRTRQPIQGTGLRHNHRLAKGLVFAVTGTAGFFDFVSCKFPNSKTGATVTPSKGGRAATPAASGGQITWAAGTTGLDTLTGVGTLLICMRSNNNAANWRVFGSREDTNTGDGIYLLFDDTNQVLNGFNVGANNNNYRANSNDNALGTNSEQSFHTFGCSWDGAGIQTWADGKANKLTSGGLAAFSATTNAGRVTRLQSGGAVSDFLFAYAWNRVLSAAEIADITANPWQIFRAPRNPVYGAVLSSSITATGANTVSTTRSAAGTVKITGTSSKAVSTTSAATGTTKIAGTSNNTVSTTAAATGAVKVTGASSKTVSTTSAGTVTVGAAPATATSSTTVSTTSAATGKTKVTGASSKAVSTTSAAAGTTKVTGTSSKAVSTTSAATGKVKVAGASSKTVSVANTASGVVGAAPATATSSTTVATTSTATGKVKAAGTSSTTVATSSTAASKTRVAGTSSRTVSTVSAGQAATAVKASSSRTVSTGNTGTVSVGNPPIIASSNKTLLPITSVQTGKVKVSGASSKTVSITAVGTGGVKVRGAGGNTVATAQAAAAATTVRGTSSRQVSTTTSGSGTVGFPPRIASSSTIAGVNASGSGTVAIRAAASTQARTSPYGVTKVALRAQGGNIVDWATHTIAMQGVPIPRPPSGATSFSRSVTVPYRPWSCDRVASYTVDVTG